jgi:hypothetical protein
MAVAARFPVGALLVRFRMGIGRKSALVVLAEFKRAVAAAQRYDDLRCRHACRDIPRRIFEEFYAFGEPDAAKRQREHAIGRLPSKLLLNAIGVYNENRSSCRVGRSHSPAGVS